MRLIKAFVVVLTGLFLIITLFSLLIPSRVRVSRAVMIDHASQAAVYDLVVHFEQWKKWHPAFTIDSAKLYFDRSSIAGADSMVHILHNGNEINISLLNVDSTSSRFLLTTKGENETDNEILVTSINSPDAVQVEWRTITKLHWYPWEKFYGIFVDKLTGPGIESALNGLKVYAENRTHKTDN